MKSHRWACSIAIVLAVTVIVAIARRDRRVQAEPSGEGRETSMPSTTMQTGENVAAPSAAAQANRHEASNPRSPAHTAGRGDGQTPSATTDTPEADSRGDGNPTGQENSDRVLPGVRPALSTSEHIDRLIERSDVVSIRNVFTDETGDRLKSTLIKTSMKYPHILIEETLSADGQHWHHRLQDGERSKCLRSSLTCKVSATALRTYASVASPHCDCWTEGPTAEVATPLRSAYRDALRVKTHDRAAAAILAR